MTEKQFRRIIKQIIGKLSYASCESTTVLNTVRNFVMNINDRNYMKCTELLNAYKCYMDYKL